MLFIGIRHFGVAPSLSDHPGLPRTGGYPLHALLYFLLGMLILSQVRFTSLTAGWRLQNIAVADGVGKAWTRYGLVFLVLIVTLVAVLPTDDSMGLFDTVRLGLQVVADLAHRLMELLILAITIPLSWLLSLFGHGEGGSLSLPPLPDTLTPAPAQKSQRPFPWEVIRASIFWLTFLAVAVYLIRSYLEDHPELVEAFTKLTFARRLLKMLATCMARLAAWAQQGLQWVKLRGTHTKQ